MKYFKLLETADISFYKKFKRQWKNYVFQITVATLSIFIAILFIKMQNAVMVASLGATIFIVFSLTVGTSMFLMAITDMEHPPACATALGIVSAVDIRLV